MESLLHRADLRTLWLLGCPVKHSLSPLIQNTALALLSQSVVYLAASIQAEEFDTAARALSSLGALGANVTVPHKERAFRLCDQLSDTARAVGAVNVLRFVEGQIVGDNTDGPGWKSGLESEFGPQVCARPALVVGAGGAARAVLHTLSQSGSPGATILNRTAGRAERLCQEFESPDFSITVAGLESFSSHLREGCLVVQTTSVGLDGQNSPVQVSQWPSGAILSELIYGQRTPLMARVAELGGQVQDGLAMLCHQAAHGLAVWLGRPVGEMPVEAMLEAARERVSLLA